MTRKVEKPVCEVIRKREYPWRLYEVSFRGVSVKLLRKVEERYVNLRKAGIDG